MKKIARLLVSALLLVSVIPTVACSTNPRPVARTTQAVAVEFRAELASMRDAGEITPEEFDAVAPAVDEIAGVAEKAVATFAPWDVLTKSERRGAVLAFVSDLTSSVARLQEQGALHVKSDKARARLDKYLVRARRGVSAARVVFAALDDSKD